MTTSQQHCFTSTQLSAHTPDSVLRCILSAHLPHIAFQENACKLRPNPSALVLLEENQASKSVPASLHSMIRHPNASLSWCILLPAPQQHCLAIDC